MSARRGLRPVVVVAVGALALAGCLGGGQPPSDPRAERLVDDAADAIERTDAYRYDISGRARVERGDRSESIRIEGAGAVNATQRRVRKTVAGGGDNETVFVDGRTAYARCPFSNLVDVDPAWYPASKIPANRSWHHATDLGTVRYLSSAPASDAGNETIDDERTHVVVLHPDVTTWEDAEREAIYPGQGRPDRGVLRNVTVRLWLDAETSHPRRVQITQRRAVRGATARSSQVLDVEYGSTTVSLPSTVASEADCPGPV